MDYGIPATIAGILWESDIREYPDAGDRLSHPPE